MSDKAGGQEIGKTLGSVGGGIAGAYYGGPAGGLAGSFLGGIGGGYLGGAIGGLFGGSDAPGLTPQQQQAQLEEEQLRARLTRIANGEGPSVAGIQLGQGLEQANRASLSNSAGLTGNNGVLARYNAMQLGANQAAQENGQAALARTQEIQNANNALAGVTGTLYTQGSANTNAANALALQQQKQNFDETTKLLGTGLKAASDYGATKATTGAAPGSTLASSLGSDGGGSSAVGDDLATFGEDATY